MFAHGTWKNVELPIQDRCILIAYGAGTVTLRWHKHTNTHTHPSLSKPTNRGRLCENEGNTCKSVENTLEDPMKTMENEAAQAKSDGQNMELSNTKQGHNTKMAHPHFKRCGG